MTTITGDPLRAEGNNSQINAWIQMLKAKITGHCAKVCCCIAIQMAPKIMCEY